MRAALVFAALVALACERDREPPAPLAPLPTTAPPPSPAGPIVEGVAFPIGAVVYAHERRRVFRGVTSDITWVATTEDGVGLLPWMSEHVGAISGVLVLDIHGPSDPGVPQAGLPPGSGAAIAVTRTETSERCAPCYDAVGARIAEPIDGCDCP